MEFYSTFDKTKEFESYERMVTDNFYAIERTGLQLDYSKFTNKFKANKLRGSVKGGFTYDPTSDTLLDASIKEQALQIRKIFGGDRLKRISKEITNISKKISQKHQKKIVILDFGCGSMEISKKLQNYSFVKIPKQKTL